MMLNHAPCRRCHRTTTRPIAQHLCTRCETQGSHRGDSFPVLMVFAAVFVLLISLCSGCKAVAIPEGAQLQSSTFGVRIAPQDAAGVPLTLGSHTTIITTPQPAEAGPNLNRFEGAAPGVNVRSTVATGDVGEQINAAGGADALRHLMNPGTVVGSADEPEPEPDEPEPEEVVEPTE